MPMWQPHPHPKPIAERGRLADARRLRATSADLRDNGALGAYK